MCSNKDPAPPNINKGIKVMLSLSCLYLLPANPSSEQSSFAISGFEGLGHAPLCLWRGLRRGEVERAFEKYEDLC